LKNNIISEGIQNLIITLNPNRFTDFRFQQIKDNERNLIMHPERVLSADDAFRLFEIAKTAIITMSTFLPEIKKESVSTS
jgi:hypothetical protein